MTETSVLLPASSITVFSDEKATREVVESLSSDWRFARVEIRAHVGDVASAIEHYKVHTSPDLLVIQTQRIDDGFTEQLEELAEFCAEGTDAIIIGPVNDVQLYRQLIQMGVSDYIVGPIEQEGFAQAIANTLIAKLGVTGSRLVVTMGSKGGVGTSMLAQGLAHGFAKFKGQKTLLVDAAGGWSANTVAMNVEPSFTLFEAAKAALRQDQDGLNRMILKADEKISVLATGGDPMLEKALENEGLEALLTMLMASWPLIIFDASAAPAELKKAVVLQAHKILMVSSPDLYALRMARALLNETRQVRGAKDPAEADPALSLIMNFKGIYQKAELGEKEIEEMLEYKIAHSIAFDPGFYTTLAGQGKKLADTSQGEALFSALLPLFEDIVPGLDSPAKKDAEPKAANSGVGGLLRKLTGKG